MKRRTAMGGRLAALALLVLAMVGCQSTGTAGYLMHVTLGQARILLTQQKLDTLDRDLLNPAEQANLALLDDVRHFAKTVGLEVEGQYTQFYASDPSWAVWVLTASPVTAPVLHTWRFPVAGRVPYLGFFSRDRADAFRAVYRDQGYHTALRTADAYSTLGWFDDPLFRAQLDSERPDFAATLFHELVHATVYQAGASAWNESVASFTESKLLDLYQRERGIFSARELSDQVDRAHDSRLLKQAIGEVRADIEALYIGQPERYPHDVTAHIDAWRKTLAGRPWRRMDGARLSQRPWPVPSLLGMSLYDTGSEILEADWQALSRGVNSVATMRAWLTQLRHCASREAAYACFEAHKP